MATALEPEIEIVDEGQDPNEIPAEIQTVDTNISADSPPPPLSGTLNNVLTTLPEKKRSEVKSEVKYDKRAELIANFRTIKERQILRKQQLLLELKREQLALEIELSMCESGNAYIETSTPHPNRRDVNTNIDPPTLSFYGDPVREQPTEQSNVNSPPDSVDSASGSVLHKLLEKQTNLTETLLDYQNRSLLPQPDVKKFDGNPLDYRTFIKAFENRIEKRISDDSDRLYYLDQLTKGEPNELVRSCLHMDPKTGFAKAKQLLHKHFGNEYRITTEHSNKLLLWSPMKPDNIDQLKKFSLALTSCLNAMHDISYLTEMNHPKNLYELMEKLPYNMRDRWRSKVKKIKDEHHRTVTFEDFATFVEGEVDTMTDPIFGRNVKSSSNYDKSKSNPSNSTKPKQSLATKTDTNQNVVQAKRVCFYCKKENHLLDNCYEFIKLPMDRRKDYAKENSLCFGCLSKGHDSRMCRKKKTCRKCDKPHPTCFHYEHSTTPAVNNGLVNKMIHEPEVLMAILPVNVKVNNSKMIKTYAFLDNGSSGCFSAISIKNKLGLYCEKTSLMLGTMHGKSLIDSYVIENMMVSDLNNHNSILLPKVFVRDNIPVDRSNIPTKSVIQRWGYLQALDIPELFRGLEIGLLIGTNCVQAHEPLKVIPSINGGPYAVLTRLGWTVNGVVNPIEHSFSVTCNRIFLKEVNSTKSHEVVVKESVREVVDPKLLCQIFERDFNHIELASTEVGPSINDKRFMNIVESGTEFKDGHFCVPLPFKDKNVTIPNNRNQAEKRLFYLRRKLLYNVNYRSDYCEFMDNLINRKYAIEVPEKDLASDSVWYIPHHGVYHPRKPNKIRVVFDCSARLDGQSLNDCLLQGPDLTNSLYGVLVRFREKPVAFMADIEAMFHQIKVPSHHCDFLRFLWWKDNKFDNQPTEFKMTSHPFGAVSSPSCANYALKKTADFFSDNELVTDTIKRDFYVDDCLKSCETDLEAIKLAAELSNACEKGGFNLTKFTSNSRSLLDNLSEDKLAKGIKNIDLNYDNLPIERALGVHWCVESDTFGFRITLQDKPLTRRGILSVVASIFDPLGLVSPFTLQAKTILREICRDNNGWDDPVSDQHRTQWIKWRNQLFDLENFKVSRCLKPKDFGTVVQRELHLFSDASSTAYGSVAYQRLINENGDISCNFIVGKARLAPVKSVTIPRLELSAATLSTKLCDVLLKDLCLKPTKTVFWTDSMTVLQYIRNERKRFHVFVSNRISTIRGLSKPEDWAYVSTNDNPADDASRGLSASELVNSRTWLMGPEFLHTPDSEWPPQPTISKIETSDPEIKAEHSVFVSNIERNPTKDFIEYFSNWFKLKRAVSWILRLKFHLKHWSKERSRFELSLDPGLSDIERKNKIDKHLSEVKKRDSANSVLYLKDLQAAENAILQFTQQNSFSETFNELNSNRNDEFHVSKKSHLYRLDPIFRDGLIKVGGRLRHAVIPDSVKYPIILPKDDHVTKLIVRDTHERLGHSGRGHTISMLREHFWIINCNSFVRHILSQCVMCRKLRAPVMSQKMADLPKDRVTPSEPFSSVGVDYFGPFLVKEGRKELKRYGVVFTCLVIRAVHIEIACSLDSSSFIQALRRFLARRGAVREIRSDNGTNFCGAERELREEIAKWNKNAIRKDLQQRNIEWIFNPPTGSHHGGAWERQIRTIRKVLNALLKGQNTVSLSDESLRTLMCEVESIINSRPLTFTSNDPDDFNPLTPNNLLNLKSSSWILPPGDFVREDVYSRKAWRQVQYLADSFWNRWQKEYLVLMQERAKWTKTERNMSVNDIVLVVDDNLPRNQWNMARVLSVNSDSLGLVRSVTVKTRSNTMQRPISKLVLLLPFSG